MKWFLAGVAAINTALSIYTIIFHPDIYKWTYALVDVALWGAAALPWLAKES